MSTINLISSSYTWEQFTPTFVLTGLALLVLIADAFLPRLSKQVYPVLGALISAGLACFTSGSTATELFTSLACAATAVCLLMAYDYRSMVYASVAGAGQEDGSAEFSALPLLACAGVCALIRSRDLIMLFVALEMVTLASYAMAGYFRRNQGSVEAGVKYLILGAVSTGFLVMGAAWFFGTTGSFKGDPRFLLAALSNPYLSAGTLVSVGLLLAGIFFKAGAVPMHTWIPDVYQGAPTPVSAFLAVVSKLAGFAALLIVLLPFMYLHNTLNDMVQNLVTLLAIVAAATLLVGNLGAIPQQNAKRLLGYSSIGQAGFILVFFIKLQPTIVNPVFNYLLAYGIATLMAFFALATLRMQRGSEEISAFRGLGKSNPRTAFMITVSFASLAGVPLTAGFLAKLSSFQALISTLTLPQHILYWLLPIMIVCAAAGFYYYFKVLRAMYWEKPQEDDAPVTFSPLCIAVLTVGTLMLIALGVTPLLF